jgi:uncharacterized membrane protein YqjE
MEKIPRPSVMDLVRGIIDDAKQLLLGQYELRKYQAEREVAKAKSVATLTAVGLPLAFIGFILLMLMVVHLLNEVASLPLWASYGIVAVVLLVAGGGFLLAAKKRM